ncbi:unnamed protein product [Phaedon cochleariae]|uniref:Suppressor of white apricot N-terminal domain-containing protein n=1 Tax=Phaedon cochleariae TaxID=80249 RepID=A0A9N9X4H2_PHACE|nr:unnamed protein product [Phaedon cochleariae]
MKQEGRREKFVVCLWITEGEQSDVETSMRKLYVLKADPTQFLQVHGRQCKIHLDPNIAAASDSAVMMPWQGQSDILIDRFDGRAHLDNIFVVTAPDEPELSQEDRQMNYERYRIIAQNSFLGIPEEKFLKQLHLEEQFGYTEIKSKRESRNGGAAIGFNYEDITEAYKNNYKLVCKECDISENHNDDEFYLKLIEELRMEVMHKDETIDKLKKKYDLFYEEAITMENDFVSKVQNHEKTIHKLQENLMNLKRECTNKNSKVLISIKTQTEKKQTEQKKLDTQINDDSEVFDQTGEYNDTMLPNEMNLPEDQPNETISKMKTVKQKKKEKPMKRLSNRRREYKGEMQMILRNNIKKRKKQENDSALAINSVVIEEQEAMTTENFVSFPDENVFNISNDTSSTVNPVSEKLNQLSLMEELENVSCLENVASVVNNEFMNTHNLRIPDESEAPHLSLPLRIIHICGDQYASGFSKVLTKIDIEHRCCVYEKIENVAEISDLTKNVFAETMNYDREDLIVIMFSTKNVSNRHSLYQLLKNTLGLSNFTNLIIITECHSVDDKNINRIIYNRIKCFKRNNKSCSLTLLAGQEQKGTCQSLSQNKDEDSDDNDSDSDLDVDLAINVSKMDPGQAHDMNKHGRSYGMSSNDFYSFLTNDLEEAETARLAREEEQEKALFSGRKSRRERRYAAKTSPSIPTYQDSKSRSASPEVPGKITYITSFGDDAETLATRKTTYADKVKYGKSKRKRDGIVSTAEITRKSDDWRSRGRSPVEKVKLTNMSTRSRSRSCDRRSRSVSRHRKFMLRRSTSKSRRTNSLSTHKSTRRTMSRSRSRSRRRISQEVDPGQEVKPYIGELST